MRGAYGIALFLFLTIAALLVTAASAAAETTWCC